MPELPKGTLPLASRATLSDAWDGFRKVVPADAPPEQYREMRRAFYAGATSAFRVMLGNLDQDAEMTQLDEAFVQSLIAECEDFARLVTAGRA